MPLFPWKRRCSPLSRPQGELWLLGQMERGLQSLLPTEGRPIQSLWPDPRPSCVGQSEHGLCSCRGSSSLAPRGPAHTSANGLWPWALLCGAHSRSGDPAHPGLSLGSVRAPLIPVWMFNSGKVALLNLILSRGPEVTGEWQQTVGVLGGRGSPWWECPTSVS